MLRGLEATATAVTDQRRIVVRERLRFARDLHDLLGPRLSAITLQCELARRHLDSRPDAAHDQLTQALSGLRDILEEARRVAHGYHCLSLETELASNRDLLESAGVETEVTLPGTVLPAPLQTVLATTVREAVTNVLKHSRARRCRLAVETGNGAVRLTVTNDGVPRAAPPAAAGLGLRSLAERVMAVGGSLGHARIPPAHYLLEARFPLS
ncbi:sensor histidine kinase [Streptomyces fungicidicus]|uniref:sensor histidine kinase n=1 Tax=Streptomyces fungicidicus TaxID=68203 RepID=UPI00364B775F